MIYFGKNLKSLRKKRNLKTVDIVDALGFTRSQWSNYENNISYPKFLDLLKIVKYFDTTETEIIHKDLSIGYNQSNLDSGYSIVKEEGNTYDENWKSKAEERLYTIQLQKRIITDLEKENEELKKASKHPISVPKMDKK